MSILAVVTEEADVGPLLTWGGRLALAHKIPFHIIYFQVDPKASEIEALSLDIALKDDDLAEQIRVDARAREPQPVFSRLKHPKPFNAIVEIIQQEKHKLLILGLHSKEKSFHTEWKINIREKAPCDIMTLRAQADSGSKCDRILIPVAGGPHCRVALRWADPLTESDDATISALHVARDFGEESLVVGLRQISKAVKAAGVTPEEAIHPKVVLANSVKEGIAKAAKDNYDLLLVGASNRGFLRRTLMGTLPETLLEGPEGISIAVIRGARPLTTKIFDAFTAWVERRVPQMTRENRIDLFERMTESSVANFDFLALTGLATFIAAIGLIQNSAAVVIGAMLVAPLMMPMIAAGLGLVQGNAVLVKDCARSIALGFSLAFAIGLFCGLLFAQGMIYEGDPAEVFKSGQLLARTKPGILDLIVALASGVAAAYVNARPNLSSALAGVAIAAALVPPIATGGISLSLGYPAHSVAAVTLFGTNLVAIILGASFALWIQGIRGNRDYSKGKVWAQRGFVALVIFVLVLAFFLGSHFLASFTNPVKAHPEKQSEQNPGGTPDPLKQPK